MVKEQATTAQNELHTKPEIAFVTDIKGECKAGATPQTTL